MRTVALFCTVLSIGCAAPAYVSGLRVAPALNPALAHDEGRFDGKDGVSLFEESWRPTTQAKAVLVMVHGLKDHADRYAVLAEAAVEKGYAVYAFDLRGHGDSDGDRVWVDSFDDYLADLKIFLERVRAKEPNKPLFLFGHSMGGAIVTLYTLTEKPALAGLLLSAPALKPGEDVSGFLIGVTKMLGSLTPTLAVLELDDNAFSRDPQVVAEMKADPLVYQGKGPARTAKELLKALARIDEAMEQLTVPLFIMHGTQDKLTNPAGSEALQQRAASTDKTLKRYEGLFHDLIHEPEKKQVMSDLLTWLDAHG